MSLRRLIASLATLVVSLLVLLQPGAVMAAPAVAPAVHLFISQSPHSAGGEAHFERGPPSALALHTTYTDPWSRGASARHQVTASGSTTTSTPAQFVQVTRVTGMTLARAQGHARALSPFARSEVAANAGAHALPAFPKALSGGPANTHVYLGIKNGKPAYAGITTNIGRRSTQHGSRFDQLQQLTTTPLTRGQARAVEEALILRNADTFSNLRHEISINHSYYGDAVQWGEAWLVRNGF